MTDVGAPLELPNGAVLANRIVKSAMSEALADAHNNPTQDLISAYAQWGRSGAGLLITGNTPVDRWHLEHAANVVLDADTDLERMQALVAAAQAGGAKIIAQIAHAGRQTPAAINPAPVSISAVPLDLPGYGAPQPASDAQLRNVIAQFVQAALQAQEAGFDGVEIHAAHGYLLSSALSPRINTRQDAWGGVLDNRARLAIEVVRAVRAAAAPTFIVAVKLNSSDFQKGGFDHTEAAQVAIMLQNEGVDFIEISGGTFEAPTAYQHTARRASTQAREAYFLDYAAQIKSVLSIPLMVTGGFRSRAVMDAAISDGKTDLIGIGRPFIIDPAFPTKLLAGEMSRVPDVESQFPPADELPRGAVLNWFCTQLAQLGRTGAADPGLALLDGHARYLEQIEDATRAVLAARR